MNLRKIDFNRTILKNNIIYSYDNYRLETVIENGNSYFNSNQNFIVESKILSDQVLDILMKRNIANELFNNKTEEILKRLSKMSKNKNLDFSAQFTIENSIIKIIELNNEFKYDYREKKRGRIVLSDINGKIFTKDIVLDSNINKFNDNLLNSYNILCKDITNKSKAEVFNKNECASIIFSPQSAGYLIHEIIGHMIEIDEKNSCNYFYINNYKNKKIAPDTINIVDTPISDIDIGLNKYDDEGTEIREAILVENGFLKNFIVTKEIGEKINQKINYGFARRESYRSKPLARMRTTYLKNNTSGINMDEMINDTEYGYFIEDIQYGRVDVSTGNYQLVCGLIYYIENGIKLFSYYGAVISGNVLSTLSNIVLVGNDLKFAFGDCMKGGQVIPVGIGSPSIKINNLNISGGYHGV